jgi:ABC-type phosphate/phosphonate transport system substrate-binding protein
MLIANARMYSVSARVGELWRQLLTGIAEEAHVPLAYVEHPAPQPLDELWRRHDKGAVFMCGLPFARSEAPPEIVAAPVPRPGSFGGQPTYWSELVVREDSRFHTLADTFGARLALTTPESQSGCVAALYYLMEAVERSGGVPQPLYREIIAPQITPMGALTAVVEGLADVAPIDSFAFCLAQEYRPELTSQVRIVARTAPTPIPPLVASSPRMSSLEAAFLAADSSASLKPLLTSLQLERFVRPPPESYDELRRRFEIATRFWRQRPLAATAHPVFADLAGHPALAHYPPL